MSSVKLKKKWKFLNNAVFENDSGDRIHTSGLIKIGTNRPLMATLEELINAGKLIGGNKKRELMFIAEFQKRMKSPK